MKEEYILRFTKMILVSNEKEDYDKIKAFGFRKITWFKSPDSAYLFFKDKKEQLKEYSVYFEHAKRGSTSVELRNLLWENKENILRVELYLNRYSINKFQEEFAIKAEKIHGVEIIREYYPEELSKEYILNGRAYSFTNYSQILKQVLVFLKEKDLCISRKDIQILYIDYFLEINKFLLEMKLKNKGWNVTFLDWGEKIVNPEQYDLVLAKSGFSSDSIESMRHLFFKATYKVLQDADGNENYPLSYMIGKVIHVKGAVLKEVKQEKYRLIELEKEAEIESLLHTSTSLMLEMGRCSSKERIKSAIDFDREYLEKGKEILKLQRTKNELCANFEMLIKLLKTYYEREAFKYVEFNENSLHIERLSDKEGFYIEYYHENNIYGTLCLPLHSKISVKIFEIQTLTKRGRLTPKKRVGIYSEKVVEEENMPPRMNEKEFALFHSVWLKAFRILPNAIEEEKEQEQIALLKQTRKKND